MKAGIGISLSGGGAKGIAHLGVLHSLNEMGIFPTHVSGTSAGAVVGAFYCSGMKPLEILSLAKDQNFSKIFRITIGYRKQKEQIYLSDLMIDYGLDISFKDLDLPLFVGVTDINHGLFKILDSGKLIPAVIASCAIPVFFSPVEIDGQQYVDGGVMNNLPVEPLLDRCRSVIGVGVCAHSYNGKVNGFRDIALRTFQLAIWNTMEQRMKQCDLAIDILEASKYGMNDFNAAQELFDIGRKAVEKVAPEIVALSARGLIS